MPKAVVVLSGGLDSSVLLHYCLAQGLEVEALSFDYGQRHVRELKAAAAVSRHRDVDHIIAPLDVLRLLAPTSALTNASIAVPEGHYEDDSMKATVVPARNLVMIALATSRAIATQAEVVAVGVHAGDHAIYPDCRAAFINRMAMVTERVDYQVVKLLAPFLYMTKEKIVRLGAALGVPFGLTWSCYKGGAQHCGKCGTCVERREAFALAGVSDPTIYDVDAPIVDGVVTL